jgi:dTDP-4-dehydrorhamnose 3,5-epimerase
MNVIETRLPGVLVLEPRVLRDERGCFAEMWHRDRYAALGIPDAFAQDNISLSRRRVLRGLHFQVEPRTQGKLVSVLQGEVWDVAVDLRSGSSTFGEWVGVELAGENLRQMWIPAGFAHGFVVTGESALFSYRCTEVYSPGHERGLRWNDPEIGIEWPVQDPIVSRKDTEAPLLGSFADVPLFR